MEHDPQLEYRHFYWELDHPEIGKHKCDGPPYRLSKTPAEVGPAPALGQHTEYVCRRLLGMSPREYTELLKGKVFE